MRRRLDIGSGMFSIPHSFSTGSTFPCYISRPLSPLHRFHTASLRDSTHIVILCPSDHPLDTAISIILCKVFSRRNMRSLEGFRSRSPGESPPPSSQAYSRADFMWHPFRARHVYDFLATYEHKMSIFLRSRYSVHKLYGGGTLKNNRL